MSQEGTKKSRGTPWHVAMEPLIVQHVIGPILKHLLQEGVTSQTDLIEKFANFVSTNTPRSADAPAPAPVLVSSEKMREWLGMCGFGKIFEQKTIYRIAPAPQAPPEQAPQVVTDPGDEQPEDPDLDDSDPEDDEPLPGVKSFVEPPLEGDPGDNPQEDVRRRPILRQ